MVHLGDGQVLWEVIPVRGMLIPIMVFYRMKLPHMFFQCLDVQLVVGRSFTPSVGVRLSANSIILNSCHHGICAGLAETKSREKKCLAHWSGSSSISWQRPLECFVLPLDFTCGPPTSHIIYVHKRPIPLTPCGGLLCIYSEVDFFSSVFIEVGCTVFLAPFFTSIGSRSYFMFFCKVLYLVFLCSGPFFFCAVGLVMSNPTLSFCPECSDCVEVNSSNVSSSTT